MKKHNENNYIISDLFDNLLNSDDYSHREASNGQLLLPGLAPPQRACPVCRSMLIYRSTGGRPKSYCCDECASAAAREQRKLWSSEHDRKNPCRSEPLVCRACGNVFEVAPTIGGRVPGFCSPECRKGHGDKSRRSRQADRLSGVS